VCPVSAIHHRGKDINIPMGPENQPNVYTSKIKTWIGDIMYGNVDHKWGVVIPERE
jgi:branched-chain amino acid aminotransferase